MSKKPVQLKRVPARKDIKTIGDFCIPEPDQTSGASSRMDIRLPGGDLVTLRITNGDSSADGQVWGWDGNVNKPTLKTDVVTAHGKFTITAGQLTIA